jgi:hypothetical protein
MWGVSEPKLLEYLREYGVDHPTLDAAFRADPALAMEKLCDASYNHPDWLTDGIVDAALAHFDAEPGRGFWILHNLAAHDETRARKLMNHYAAQFPRHPAAAIDALAYVATNNPRLLRQDLVDLVAAHASADASRAFQTFSYVLWKRPELITRTVVESVVEQLGAQANLAFSFIRDVLKGRPEFTPLCTLALFDCVFREPHPYQRREMLQDIVSIASRSHIQTGLEGALRQPAARGSRPARVLMAILFRQSSRALQRVLLESLDNAAKWPSLWDFLRFLIETSDPKQVSTAAAEKFLEGSYRLQQIVTPYEFEKLLVEKLDLRDPPAAPFPPEASFLDGDPALSTLHATTAMMAKRFGTELKLAPLDQFRARAAAAERERSAISAANTTRRRRRRESLEARLAGWSRGEVGPRERRALAKTVLDAHRAQAADIAQRAIDAGAKDAYRAAVKHVLGRDVDLDRIEPAVLPAFLYHGRLGRMPNNRKYLARLIEDRIEGRPHDWMRSEPPAARWAESVKKAWPEIRLERWRAEFKRDYAYQPETAAREKQRRVEHDLEQTRALFARLKVEEMEKAGYKELREKFLEIRPTAKDPALVEEIGNNLERIRIALQQEDESDYEGKIALEVETDPFQVLFMGEYGFASCLSLRGANVWSAVSNAIDIDKAVVWARDPSGNIVGRRLIALTPHGVVSYRTYTNRHGLSLDGFFEKFLDAYAEHCGTKVTHRVSPGPLLSDDWYDDGSI